MFRALGSLPGLVAVGEGGILDETGSLVRTFGARLDDVFRASRDDWPLHAPPVVVKGCKREDALETRGTILLSKPERFRTMGETIGDAQEARFLREVVETEQRVNNPVDMERSRRLDDELNTGARLIGATGKTTTGVRRTTRSRTTTRTVAGKNGWIYCTGIEPTDTNRDRWLGELSSSYTHASRISRPRAFARALGVMVTRQIGPQGPTYDLAGSVLGAGNVSGPATSVPGQTVFHGPVVYVDDPYAYLVSAGTEFDWILRLVFTKRSRYRNQCEYRFLVWADKEPDEMTVTLDVSSEMLAAMGEQPLARWHRTVVSRFSAPGSSLRSDAAQADKDTDAISAGGEPLADSAVPVADTQATGTADPLPSVFDVIDNPAYNTRPHTLDPNDPPDDLHEKTRVYEAVTALRQKVEQTGNYPAAASAAWHAEPYVRLLCAEFTDPIGAIRFDGDHVVITVKFPPGSSGYGRIAVGPQGTASARIGNESGLSNLTTDGTTGPMRSKIDRSLRKYGLPTRQDTGSEDPDSG